jgi:CubicO group peptidase (beta-lactamase class C family)
MFRLTRTGTIVLIALLSTAGSAGVASKDLPAATPESVGLSGERLARMTRAIHAYVDAGRTPGVVTLVARHGKVVHVDAYGKADLAAGRPTRADDIFRMYSMTKPITSVALLMLYEEGKFQLTDPLSRYFPAFADVKVYAGSTPQGGMLLDSPRRPITIQDVFRHTAGFSYGIFGGTPVDKAYEDAGVLATNLTDMMEKLPKLPLLYQPGERWVYSVAHDVQAALVEKLSGQKFDDFVRQRIFAPLGMQESMFRIPADKKSRVPALYTADRDGKLVPDTSDLGRTYGDAVFGGYSISTTIGDYALFAQMLLNKGQLDGVRLLSPKTVELMATNHVPAAALAAGSIGIGLGPGTGYGLGVSVLMDPAERGNLGSAGEFGWSGAASTHVLIDPKEDLVALYCTQLSGGPDFFALRSEFVTLLYQSIVGD